MKNDKSTLIIVAIMLPIVVALIYSTQYILNKTTNAMLLSKLVPFMQKWEGGLSKDQSDSESIYPAPWSYKGVNGYHTNKGITYRTFIQGSKKFGYAPTAENFFAMPDHIWLKILKDIYMAAYPLDQINHLPRIQAVVITWSWGSGNAGSEGYLADFQREVMGINDSNITKAEIIQNFKKHITPLNEKAWFLKLCERRKIDYSKMNTCNVHCTGWNNRLNEFKKLFS